jgi:uncharacterized protein (DUF427 family)
MSKSPGHQKWPDHHVTEHHVKQKVTARLQDKIIAESDDAIRVDEDGHPARYYFPKADVRMELLQASATTTECPFKGVAHYYTVNQDGQSLEDAAWSYDQPYDEHAALKDRVAFYEEKAPGLHVTVAK